MKAVVVFLFVLIFGFMFVNLMPTGSAQNFQKPMKTQDDATPIEVGVMSKKQKRHSELYKGYSEEVNVLEKIKQDPNDVELHRLLPITTGMRHQMPSSTYELLKRIACSADAVVLGQVTSKSSQLTQAKNFVFTDYGFSVQEVMKNIASNPIESGGAITVTRPGGAVIIKGKRVRAIDESFPLLNAGPQYLLFLRYIPETESFRSIEGGESFELNGGQVKWLGSYAPGRIDPEYSPYSLLKEIRGVVIQQCSDAKGGTR